MLLCEKCAAPVPVDALACPSCQALVHARELEALVAQATAHAKAREFGSSLAAWRQALALLPPNTQQATWVADQILRIESLPESQRLSSLGSQPSDHAREPPNWAKRLGPLGAILFGLLKAKTFISLLANAKFLLSFGAFIGVYWSIYGAAFGIGFAVSIFIHEMGHYLEVRRRGLPADMPVFLPGLGAYVQWQHLGVPLRTRSLISLAGPLAGALAAGVCLFMWQTTGGGVWAALAHAGAWLNLLNLIAVPIFDGGHAARSLDKTDRWLLLGTAVLLFAFFGEGVYLLVAGGCIWLLFSKDRPAVGDRVILLYMQALLVVLGLIMHAAPDRLWMR
jgi:Zn-dependent protease